MEHSGGGFVSTRDLQDAMASSGERTSAERRGQQATVLHPIGVLEQILDKGGGGGKEGG